MPINKSFTECYYFSCPDCKARPHTFCKSLSDGDLMETTVHSGRYDRAVKKFRKHAPKYGLFGA